MNEQLMREIRIELGEVYISNSDYASTRASLCHPTCTSDAIEDVEELSNNILKTPIECGSYAYIYNGYAVLGAVSDDGKVFISGEGLKTPERARAVNEVLHIEGHFLDPSTWIYTAGNESSYVSDNGLLVSDDGIESERVSENDISKVSVGKLKFYIEYIMEMLQEFGGIPEQALQQCQEAGYATRESGHEYSSIDSTIESLLVSEDLIMDALELRGMERADQVSGRAVWSMKQDMQNIINAAKGLPTQFKA